MKVQSSYTHLDWASLNRQVMTTMLSPCSSIERHRHHGKTWKWSGIRKSLEEFTCKLHWTFPNGDTITVSIKNTFCPCQLCKFLPLDNSSLIKRYKPPFWDSIKRALCSMINYIYAPFYQFGFVFRINLTLNFSSKHSFVSPAQTGILSEPRTVWTPKSGSCHRFWR